MAMGYPLKSEFYEYSVEELGKLYKDIVKRERAFIGTITGMNRKKEKTPQYQTDIREIKIHVYGIRQTANVS